MKRNIAEEKYMAVRAAYDMLFVSQGPDITDEKVVAVANKLLENSPHTITDLDLIREDLIASRYLKIDEMGHVVPKIRIQGYTFNGDGPRRIYDALKGKVIHLYLLKLKQVSGEYYEIKFNVDGKGAVELPTGEVANKALSTLAHSLMAERSLPAGALGPGSWYIVKGKHPDVNKRGRVRLQDYLDNHLE